jgi:hypothetical protein
MAQEQVDKPVASSKASHYGFIALAVGLAVYIYWLRMDPNPPPTRPVPTLIEGAVIDAPVTLVSADKHDLACAWESQLEGHHCEYATADKTWAEAHPESNPKDRTHLLAPYKTIDDVMFLIPGLFEDKAVEERYRDEPPQRAGRDKLNRFTAQCKLKLHKEVEGVQVRWNPKGPWQGPHKVWVGTVSNCQTSEP